MSAPKQSASKQPRSGITIMRSPLAQARGLGSAKSGFGDWWAIRMTSVALVPLTLWFVWAALHLAQMPLPQVRVWASNPMNATLLLALVVATFWHMRLGLQVVIEDYVHGSGTHLAAQLVMKAVTLLLGLASALAVIKLAVVG